MCSTTRVIEKAVANRDRSGRKNNHEPFEQEQSAARHQSAHHNVLHAHRSSEGFHRIPPSCTVSSNGHQIAVCLFWSETLGRLSNRARVSLGDSWPLALSQR